LTSDRYSSFEEMRGCEREGIDYRMRGRSGTSRIAVFCIHGGEIEPGTSRIADAIAGNEHSFYALEGLKVSDNRALHITSTVFDEPAAMEIVCESEIIISIHGCADTEELVHIGGLDHELKGRIQERLIKSGFRPFIDANPAFRALDQRNLCNLCGRGMGVQLEISRGLREKMFRDLTPEGRQFPTETFHRFVQAVREAIEPFKAPAGEWAQSAGCERLQ
jgi:phage replication-related protein YjqB (UPF0714/DUF867 family)